MSIKSLRQSVKTAEMRYKEMLASKAPMEDLVRIRDEKDALVALLKEQEQIERDLHIAANYITAEEIVSKFKLAYLTQDDEFSITRDTSGDPDRKNVVTRTYSSTRIINTIKTLLQSEGMNSNIKMNAQNLIDYCIANNRSYTLTTSSFNTVKWDKNVHNHMIELRDFWAQPIDSNIIDPVFDEVVHCIAGGKQENIDHICSWVAYKYLHPEDTVNIPNINISGIPGENGKGLFKILLKTIFTDGSVIDATAKEVVNGFNAKWRDAVILIYEEMSERELPENKLKALTGNPELVIENKGKDAFMSDANYNILFFDNNINGTVKLAGSGPNGEDRRYSIIETSISLPPFIQDKYGISEDDAKLYCQKIAERFRSREEVGKWLHRQIIKYNVADMDQAPKLHGEDYYNRIANQTTELDALVSKIARITMTNTIMPVRVMLDHVQDALGESFKVSSQTLTKKVMAEIKRQGKVPHKCKITKLSLPYKLTDNQLNNTPAISIFTADDVPSLTIDTEPFRGNNVVLFNTKPLKYESRNEL